MGLGKFTRLWVSFRNRGPLEKRYSERQGAGKKQILLLSRVHKASHVPEFEDINGGGGVCA